MIGTLFTKYQAAQEKSSFQRLFDLFMEMLHFTSGDAAEALNWLTQIDREHRITDDEYGIGDFIEELKQKGYLQENEQNGGFEITAKTEQTIRKRSLEEIFGKLKKTKRGNHHTFKTGQGDEMNPETRAYQFGDAIDTIDY